MSRVCEVTGKSVAVGNRVSHANNKKRRRFLPNLHTQRFWLEGERRWVSLRVSTRGRRTSRPGGSLGLPGSSSRLAPAITVRGPATSMPRISVHMPRL